MVIAANAAVGKSWAHHATGILAGLLAGATFLFGAIDWAGANSGQHNPLAVDIGIMFTALLAATLASKPVRERASRLIPIDPDNPVHTVALVLGVILLGTQVSSIAFTDVLAADQKLPPLSIGDLISQEAPFLVIAAVGVGLYLRRNLGDAATRLGLIRPEPWQIALALAAAGAFFGLSVASSALSSSLTPGIAQQVDKTSQHLFGALNNPTGILALALVPGICEEILFRGALQPRLGLVATAVLFTAIHTEYGISIDVLTILAIAVGLGLIRKYANTTASIACHVAYNLVVGLSPSGQLLWIGIGLEALLVAIAVVAIKRRRRAAGQAVPEESGLG
jgi:membrane protease YdiL (CAAX protease family)